MESRKSNLSILKQIQETLVGLALIIAETS